ncbi:MAG TPA: SPOR domain-containing protein [Terriglobales bacterium]|nr:SPOR domain-containing protein [Terriglobales bacterium]
MNSTQDTEITLGTGKMLFLFFGLVALCAVFFGVGFSLGRGSARTGIAAIDSGLSSSGESVVRPSAVKSNTAPAAASSQPVLQPVVQKESTPVAKVDSTPATAPAADDATKSADTAASAPGGNYYVQVAAVSKQEDADALVDALKKKQYSAFAATNSPADKLFHVQIGPFGDVKDAELTRAKLISDGYNPILKK